MDNRETADFILIFHFFLLLTLPIASALLIVTDMSLLLSIHRFMWLSQMLLCLTALGVCSEAEPFKQFLCLLDFVLKQVKRTCMVTASELRGGQELRLDHILPVTAGVS